MVRVVEKPSRPIGLSQRFNRKKISARESGSVQRGKNADVQYTSVTITDDRGYVPASSMEVGEVREDVKKISKKLDKVIEKLPQSQPELLEPEYCEVEIKALRVHVISLCGASVLATLLILIGAIAPLIKGLPHRMFWLSMGFPAAGVALGNLIILLGGREGKD